MSLIKEIDYGTPAATSEKMVALTIDGVEVTAREGTSIMRAAMEIGTEIPKLCASDMLESFGSCRLCLVEIEGRNGTPASCTTPIAPGMIVRTQTPRLKALRKGVMELYISDHPLDCLTCAANGDCELQTQAGAVGLREVRYGYQGANHLGDAKDQSNPYFTYDPAKCIVCNRCVRACEEVQGTFALTIDGRGFASRVAAGKNEPFLESECVSCGACVQACPTATLMEKSVIEIGLPEHSAVTTCAYCGVGCTFKAEMRGEELVRMVPYKDGKANHGHSCVKGRFAWGYATHRDRILKPMIRASIEEPWREVSWEEAIGYAASEFKRVQAAHGKHAIGGITSSRCTNEETYLVQKLVRAGFGNNNVDTCARVCHSPTGYGLGTAFGTSAGTQDFDSIDETDVMMVVGANPTDGHPVFASRMKKRLREGAKLIVVDPRRIDMVRMPHVKADYHLALTPGTNVAVLTALAHVVVTFVRGKGKFVVTEYIATDERTGPRFPLLLTTGRILSHYNVGAQTRRTANVAWHPEDRLEIHPHDAEQRGVADGDWVKLRSRAGETTLRALITDRVAPGVVYTTFHHPTTQANVVTTEFSDWATNCPEFKVTAVQVSRSNGPSEWQESYQKQAEQSRRILHTAEAAE
jgi:formate dehydrogenase major subunit